MHKKQRSMFGRGQETLLRWVGCAFVIACTMLQQQLAAQARTIGMTSVVGFSGYYSPNHWVPVDIAIDNPGRATSGILTVNVDYPINNNRIESGTLRWPVQLPPRGWTHVKIAVPGTILSGTTEPEVTCTVQGRVVSRTYLSGTALGNISLVAVLTENPQDAQFLTGSTGPSGSPVLPVTISLSSLPHQANLFNNLTAVVATPTTLATLRKTEPAVSQALQTWVRLGGLLLVPGTSSTKTGWPLPMIPSQVRRVSGLGLQTYLGNTTGLPKALRTDASGLHPGAELLAGTPSLPLLAEKRSGRGAVMQTSFAPTDLLQWPNNVSFWTSVLKDGSAGGQSALPALLDLSQGGVLSLADASDTLAPLRVPSLTVWATVFGIYTLIAGPLLFMILRRRKQESSAWVILPVLSVLTTIGIYAVGAAQRPTGMLTEGVGVLDLAGNGQAETYGIRSFMSPSVTSAISIAPSSTLVLPLAEQTVRQLGEATVMYGGRVVTSIHNVGRWGVRYVYTAGTVAHQGEFRTNLSAAFGLIGTLQNNTPYNLHHVALFWNGQMFPLGDLRRGESINISQQLAQSISGSALVAYTNYNHDITHGLGRPLGSYAANLLLPLSSSDTGEVVATIMAPNAALPALSTEEHVASSQSMVFLRQFVTVSSYPLG